MALGTASGDLVAEKLNLGYSPSIAIWPGAITLSGTAHFTLKVNAILAF